MDQDNNPIDALLNRFEAHLKKRDLSAHSVRAYLSDVRLFFAWLEEHIGEPVSLTSVTEFDVQDWRDEQGDVRKPATVNRRLAALSAFFEWAREQKLVKQDPSQHVHGIEQQETAPKSLSKQDMNRILHRVKDSGNLRDIALLEFLAATGLRAAEAAALRRGDLEMGDRSGWVTVRRAGKGRKQRKVPVNVRARTALEAYLKQRGETKESNLDRNVPLFLSRLNQPMTPYAVWYTVKKYAALSNVENVSPHTFRHTVATRLVRNPKVDIVTAATYMGHSRLDTTARYSRPSEDDLEDASEMI